MRSRASSTISLARENVVNVVDLFLSYHIGDISRIRNKDLRTLCSCNNLICLFSLCDS